MADQSYADRTRLYSLTKNETIIKTSLFNNCHKILFDGPTLARPCPHEWTIYIHCTSCRITSQFDGDAIAYAIAV